MARKHWKIYKAIYRHIAPDSPSAADKFVREIEARCEALCGMPQMGVSRSDLREGIRVFPMKRRVVIVYMTTEKTLDILRVFYGGRDYEAIIGSN